MSSNGGSTDSIGFVEDGKSDDPSELPITNSEFWETGKER